MGLYDRDYGRDEYGSSWDPGGSKPKSAVIILIVINVAAFFIDFLSGGAGKESGLTGSFSVTPDVLWKPWLWWKFITYGFAHDPNGINHILFNMLGLFIFGRPVEQRLGFSEFIRFYLVAVLFSGVIGTAAYAILGVPASIIGASGAVVAVTVLFACFYPNSEVLLFFVLPMKAWVLAVGFVAIDVLGAMGLFGGSRTAFEVHLAGAAFAALYYFRRWDLRWISMDGLGEWRHSLQQRSRRMKLKIHDPDRKLAQEEVEADRILAKIHAQGEASLTSSERKTLERYSRRKREKRGL